MSDFGEVALDKRPIDMSIHETGGAHAQRFDVIERKY
jgi:hypothetical protein